MAKEGTTPGIAIGTQGPGVEVARPDVEGHTPAPDHAPVTVLGAGPGIVQGQETAVVQEIDLGLVHGLEIAAVPEEAPGLGHNQEIGNVLDHVMKKGTVVDPAHLHRMEAQRKR